MIPTIEDLQGTWISKDFPNYNYEDKIGFTFHFGKYATLYFSKGADNKTIAEGTYEVEDMGAERFNIIVDGRFRELFKTTLNARLYIKKAPSCFAMLVPEYGWRYFEKL